MINILHIIHKYRGDYGLLNLQVALDPNRYRTVVCYLSGVDDGANGLDAMGVKTLYLGIRPGSLRFHNLTLLRRLKSIMEEEEIHVVNCQQHRSTPVGVFAAMLAVNRPAVVSTLHGLGFAGTLRRKAFNWLLYKKVFRVIGVSHGVAADILNGNWRLAAEKVVTVQNGLVYTPFFIDESQQQSRSAIIPEWQDGFWFGTVGRLSEVKNHHCLIKAFYLIHHDLPAARLVIAGAGDQEFQLKQQVASLGLEDRVRFLGFRRDIPRILHALDVFVLPSLREGFGLALLEAMASGLPVIAARVGGIPEIVAEGTFGRLVDAEAPATIADAMKSLALLPRDQLVTLGQEARSRAVEGFTAERMIRDYEQVYAAAYGSWLARQGGGLR